VLGPEQGAALAIVPDRTPPATLIRQLVRWARTGLWADVGCEGQPGGCKACVVDGSAAGGADPWFICTESKLEEQIMPRGDRTGPRGIGAMTGRGAGFCAGYDVPGFANPAPGFGRGMGGWATGRGGGGRGWRHWYYATGVPGWMRYGAQPGAPGAAAPRQAAGNEREALEAEMDWLQERLNALRGQIDELEEQSE
jgi:hypothetical protein